MNERKMISEIIAIDAAAAAIVCKMREENELDVLFYQAKKARIAISEETILDKRLALKELIEAANKYPGIDINVYDDFKLKLLISSIFKEIIKLNNVA